MPMISVRAKKGITAYTAARGGVRIPSDNFIQVEETPYISRLVNFWQDLEVEKQSDAKPAKADTVPAASAASAKPSSNGPVPEPTPSAANAK